MSPLERWEEDANGINTTGTQVQMKKELPTADSRTLERMWEGNIIYWTVSCEDTLNMRLHSGQDQNSDRQLLTDWQYPNTHFCKRWASKLKFLPGAELMTELKPQSSKSQFLLKNNALWPQRETSPCVDFEFVWERIDTKISAWITSIFKYMWFIIHEYNYSITKWVIVVICYVIVCCFIY